MDTQNTLDFLCLWNSRADGKHFEKIHWLTGLGDKTKFITLGMHNVNRKLLVSQEKIFLLSLRIKLGLVKSLLKLWVLRHF